MNAPWRCILIAASLLGAAACGVEIPDTDKYTVSRVPPSGQIGQYTPGSKLGTKVDDAGFTPSEITDSEMRDIGGIDTCVAPVPELGMSDDEVKDAAVAGIDPAARPRTQGTLTATFGTPNLQGMWKPASSLGVWIEDVDKRPVKRLAELTGMRWLPALTFYYLRACRTKSDPDVITGATLKDHSGTHTMVWNTLDFDRNVVPDGNYVLLIENNDADRNVAPRTEVPFKKGPEGFTMTPPDGPATVGLTVTYTPGVPIDMLPGAGAAGGPAPATTPGAAATPAPPVPTP